ncbi:hypothetical protein [Nocardia amikacinitolerans]|uniref:hypothetical protein n=1 Tax=Nocardia amikacinitolerans TaxID=756689 RepID=UPI0020A392EB|nr:hypothetical protein [Nocardia amikacinitolerans]
MGKLAGRIRSGDAIAAVGGVEFELGRMSIPRARGPAMSPAMNRRRSAVARDEVGDKPRSIGEFGCGRW